MLHTFYIAADAAYDVRGIARAFVLAVLLYCIKVAALAQGAPTLVGASPCPEEPGQLLRQREHEPEADLWPPAELLRSIR